MTTAGRSAAGWLPVRVKALTTTVAVALVVCGGASVAGAQVRPGRGRAAPPIEDGGVSPAELQRLFDAYVVMQAQQELQLNDEQWGRFLTRVKVLQDARRRGQTERNRVLVELRRLSLAPESDDTQIRAQLKALADVAERTATEVQQALDGVDQVLTPRQQARFRLFEEQVERRKIELVMRARQANRPKNQF